MSQPTIPELSGTPATPGLADRPSSPAAVAAPEHACANCGAALLGPYCAQCGQKAQHRIVSLRHILEDALEDQLSLNAALPRTVRALFFHPGRLTREYVSGRVVSYIPPMRLYLIASVLFFLVMSTVPDTTEFKVQGPTVRPPAGAPARAQSKASAPAPPPVMIRIDTTGASGWRGRFMRQLGERIVRVSEMQRSDASRVLTEKVVDTAPKVLFVMVPVFALLLKLLYLRRRRLYVEHFVFGLHVHALAFLAFTPLLVVQSLVHATGRVGVIQVPQLVVFLLLAAYVLRALRVVYGQGWGRTLAKWALLGFSYLLVLVVGMATVLTIVLFEV